MLTYDLQAGDQPKYYRLYTCIREDILRAELPPGQKLPSKRALAEHLSLSKITVETAYAQLLDEGYLTSRERSGYFVAHMPLLAKAPARYEPETAKAPEPEPQQNAAAELFPFSVWAKLMRSVILDEGQYLLQPVPNGGLLPLRLAIAEELARQRGLVVQPEQIVIGAGTEVLYSLLVQLLGQDRRYAVEDPGYGKIARIYRSNRAAVSFVPLDESGLSVSALRDSRADVVHISPSHHYPTGLVMPIARRQQLLSWAREAPGRCILEDDYDSEFRFVGRPIPTLFSIDGGRHVIYLNTFSKTIAPSIRISFMVLPRRLLADFRQKLGFYACTVSGFEQYTLAKFMAQGRYEQHLSRMKARYRQKRDAVIAMLRSSPLADRVEIMEQDAGLHFLVRLDTRLPDAALRSRAAEQGVRLALLSDYYSARSSAPQHIVVVNYSGIDLERLPEGLRRLAQAWEE